MTRFSYSSYFPYSQEELFELHCDVRNLGKFSLPGQTFRLTSEPKRTEMGDMQQFDVGMGPLTTPWLAEITMFDPPRLLEDIQVSGPFRRWRHQHQVSPEGEGSRLTDVVAFRLLPTPLGELLEWLAVRPVMMGMFWYRHRRTHALLAEARDAKHDSAG